MSHRTEPEPNMDRALLATKLRIPPIAPHVMRRERLLDALEADVPRHRLTVVTAPAGYGKTTLLASWAASCAFPVIWLTLDEDDNSLDRILRYLFTGWSSVCAEVRGSELGLLLGDVVPNHDAVLAAFVNVASAMAEPLTVVLDDYHLIEEPAVHKAMAFLVDHLPPTFHIVLASRAEPPFPLGRYRARRELFELSVRDLQFKPEETEAYLRDRMGLDLSPDELSSLSAKLEGWIAGLQLVGLSTQHGLAHASKLTVAGDQRYIAEYLSEDVLTRLPEASQRFLLQTCILDHLCGPLCDAVAQGHDGQSMLDSLERENVFLIALDEKHEWFSYHPLFAEFLQRELTRTMAGQMSPLHGRAAKWYLAQGMPDPAIRHALAAADAELVEVILDRYLGEKLVNGETHAVVRWLTQIPMSWRETHPLLLLADASIDLYSGQPERGLRRLEEVERWARAQGGAQRNQIARVEALRCFAACQHESLEEAKVHAKRALNDLPQHDTLMRTSVYGVLGDTYRLHKRWADAKACYLRGMESSESRTTHAMTATFLGALADLDIRQGHLRLAFDHWERALGVIEEPETWGMVPLPLSGWVHIRLGEIYYEWNELERAQELLEKGRERARLGGDTRSIIMGHLLGARLSLTAGDTKTAGQHVERASRIFEGALLPGWLARFERTRVEWWLASGGGRRAAEWANALLDDPKLDERADREQTWITIVRALESVRDSAALSRAQQGLEHALTSAREEGLAGVSVDGLALQALQCWRRGDHASALVTIEQALRLAEPEGYVRLFADYGLSMARLLQEARARGVAPDYIQRILGAFGARPVTDALGGNLPEPLSERETAVVRLLAAGLTNREIGEALVISSETVKKHTSSIYTKLGATNRTEAAARARELELLD